MEQLVKNLQISVNQLTSSFQNIQQIYKNSNNNLNVEHNISIDYKYIDDYVKQYIDKVDDKIKKLINDNNELNKIITEKINNNINNPQVDNSDLIIKNNLYINERIENFNDRLDNFEFNKTNGLRTDEINKIKSLIHSQDDIYKCINDDIKDVKNDCNILRNRIIDNWTDIIDITKILQNNFTEFKNNINLDEIKSLKLEIDLIKDIYNCLKNDYEILKEDNNKLKSGMKLILDKINKLKI